jgi:hypothetical protein
MFIESNKKTDSRKVHDGTLKLLDPAAGIHANFSHESPSLFGKYDPFLS